jgi:hypothetical protein
MTAEMNTIKARIKALTEIGAYDPEELIAAVILVVGDQLDDRLDTIDANIGEVRDALLRVGDKLDDIKALA